MMVVRRQELKVETKQTNFANVRSNRQTPKSLFMDSCDGQSGDLGLCRQIRSSAPSLTTITKPNADASYQFSLTPLLGYYDGL